LDIALSSEGKLVSHPLVRYLQVRNTIISEKIEQFSEIVHGINNNIVLDINSQEEYIPSLTLDTFFAEDINQVKHDIKSSVQSKSMKALIKRITSNEMDGEHFQQIDYLTIN